MHKTNLAVVQSYIGGEYQACAHGSRIPLIHPESLQVAGHIEEANAEQVEHAVAAGHKAFIGNRTVPLFHRISWLNAAAGLMEERKSQIAELILEDVGKPRRIAEGEVVRSIQFVRACAIQLQSMGGETLPLDMTVAGAGRFGFTRRVPYGVVAAITPFNAPANLLIQKIAPALAAGNAVIVKPHLAASRTTLAIAECFHAGGFPSGLLGVVVGDRMPVAPLVTDRRIRAITFTGGSEAGNAIARLAGAKKFIAELGSNSANIVLEDADLGDAAKKIASAAFEASGQQCVSAQRVIVAAAVYEEFLAHLVAATLQLKVGSPRDKETDIGPMVSITAADKVMGMAESAIKGGATYVLAPKQEGCFVTPGIIADDSGNSSVWKDEVFGPLVVIRQAKDIGEALDLANDSPFGLQGAVFTRSLPASFECIDEFDVGSLWINEASRFRLDTYPFGGVKDSGFGREGVRFAIEELSQLKFIGIKPR